MTPATVLANEIFDRLRTPDADLATASDDVETIYFDPREYPIEGLRRFRKLRGMMVAPRTPEAFDAAVRIRTLETLGTNGTGPTGALPERWDVPALRELLLNSAQHTTSIAPLAQLSSLRRLSIVEPIRLADYGPLAGLTGLEELEFGVGTHTQKCGIDSLEFLRPMRSLKTLRILTTSGPADGSVAALASLADTLEHLEFLPRAFTREQVALLAARMPQTRCDYFPDGHSPFFACFKCKAKDAMAMVPGPARNFVCRACEPKKFERALADFRALVEAERAPAGGSDPAAGKAARVGRLRPARKR